MTLTPVAKTVVGVVAPMDIVFIRLDFLTHAMQRPEEAHQGRNYALTPQRARELAQQIQAALAKLESEQTPGSGLPTH